MRFRALLLAVLMAAALMAAGPSASELYSAGRKAEKKGRMAEAYLLYARAAALEPWNAQYWQRSQGVRARAMLETAPPSAAPVDSDDNDAGDEPEEAQLPPITPQDRADARRPMPPVELAAQPIHKDFNLRGDARKLFEEVTRAFGLECDFDADYSPTQQIRFRLNDVDYRDALHGLELATGSFIVPLSDRRFLVAKDTPQKRAELEPVVAIEIHLPEAGNPQDFSAIITAVQQALALQKVSWDTANNTVVIRDTVSKVIPARLMFENFMYPKAQVAIELRFLEVSRNDAITYGINLQTQFPLAALTNWFNNKPSFSGAISGLLAFGGGKTFMGLGVIDASIVAKMSHGSGSVLLESMIRSVDGQPASLHVGDRYPILSSGYFGPSSFSSGTGSLYTPPPSFNFEDLGLNLKLIPMVHGDSEVTLDVDADFKVLTGAAIDGIPIISNRNIKSRARLRFGEWAAVAGLLNAQEARSIAGVAGLSRIPYLGPLFSVHDNTKSTSQVLLLMRPYLLSLPPSDMKTYSLHLGSDTRPITPL